MNLISKRDLLALTGISYGQLYRWKREGLIPEEWFIKQSSYTGQETFLPREQALSRVRSILELKDSHSLEELAQILAPVTVPGAALCALSRVEELPSDLRETLGDTECTLPELAALVAGNSVCAAFDLAARLALAKEILATKLTSSACTCCFFSIAGIPHMAYVKGTESIVLPKSFSLLAQFHLGESADRLGRTYYKNEKLEGNEHG